MKILVADDDKVLTQILATRLRKWGYEVEVAYDAMQTIMMAMKHPPDALILDINMPAGTGRQVLRQLRSSTKTSQTTIIVLTGSIEPETAESVISLGADEYMPKPPDFVRLEEILKTRLDASAL